MTTIDPNTDTRTFETETCSRCAGSGSFSYCQMYGSTCFKCHGKTKVYTTRGKAAVAFLHASRKIKVSDVKIGDRINVPGTGKFTVRTSQPSTVGTIREVNGEKLTTYEHWELAGQTLGLHTFPNEDVELILKTATERNAQRSKALDYQDTLTKAGTVRKTMKQEAA